MDGALIGCGFFAQNHLHAWQDLAPRARLVAVCDTDPEKAQRAAAAFSIQRWYTDATKMFETERLDLYGNCLAVMFVPIDEDLGYVTLEAMLCAKAVLTASDSGGPLDFVEDGQTGCVRHPDIVQMAEAMDQLWSDRARTRAMGRAGHARYADMRLGWSRVLECLLD